MCTNVDSPFTRVSLDTPTKVGCVGRYHTILRDTQAQKDENIQKFEDQHKTVLVITKEYFSPSLQPMPKFCESYMWKLGKFSELLNY